MRKEETIDIYAQTGIYTLLHEGKPKLIGYIVGFDDDKQKVRYTGGGCIVPEMIVFHFGTQQPDIFFFEDDKMTYQSVSIRKSKYRYITKLYSKCALEQCNAKQFVELIQHEYTITQLGF